MPPKYLKNLSAAELTQLALKHERDTILSDRGALVVRSYRKSGRSPRDKRVVDTPDVHDNVDWGNVNIALSEDSFAKVKAQALNFLNSKEQLYVVDAYAGHDTRYALKIRVITTRPYHALFMRNMLMVPTEEQMKSFGEPDYIIYNAGECLADKSIQGLTSDTCVAVNFKSREQVILGTEYAGEMKKGVLTIMFELMPRQGHLTMHASANEGIKNKDVTVFFGLSGTGKTTLSADPNRALIGDDEHVWTDKGVFNIEGGCYAKAVGLNPKTEKEIFDAVRFGAVAENCVLKGRHKAIDFDDETICKNTRVAYPLDYIPGSKAPAVGDHPRNIIFLTNDAFGVMPPIARLTPAQAMFWFVTGYTANVPGIEAGGAKAPVPTFSPCFGGPFLVRHPTFYGEQLSAKMKKHNANVWLLNTGYAGGRADRGAKRMPLKVTRALIDAIHSGELNKAEYDTLPGWGLQVPRAVSNVPSSLLNPAAAWADKALFTETTNELVDKFQKNFNDRFASKASAEMRAAVPQRIGASSKL